MIKLNELLLICGILEFDKNVDIDFYSDRITLSYNIGEGGVDIFEIDEFACFEDKLDQFEKDKCSVINIGEDINFGVYDYRVK